MTEKQALKHQTELAKHYNLAWWYGTDCKKCCSVYPRLEKTDTIRGECFYRCEVCGKRTKAYIMPWLARDAWNNNENAEGLWQLSLF